MEHKQHGPFTVLSSEEKYKNPWIQVREDRVIRPGGKEGIFGVVTMLPGSSIVAVDNDNNVILIREFKYAVGHETLELVSGGFAAGETALEAAQRELKEETGYVAGKWTALGCIDPFTTVVASPNSIFLAQELSLEDASPDEGEMLKIERVPFATALQMVLDGKITHGASCVGILRAARALGT